MTTQPTTRALGDAAEARALAYLVARGLLPVARNYRVARGPRARGGEVDLIVRDADGTLVFVEVKTRVSHDAGHPADAVDRDKQHRLTRLAMIYLKRHGLLETPARFDVIAITWPANKRRPTIEHFKNAFEPVGQGQMFY